MKFLLKQLEKHEQHFQKGGKLSFLHSVWDMHDTILFTPAAVTNKGPHVRDSMDLKRLMITVVIALVPCLIFGIYNAGYQSAVALGIQNTLTTGQIMANGAWLVLPIVLVSYATGGFWEVLFGTIRKHPISEGFLVTGMLLPLTLPATIPLWQVAVGCSFGIVIGKEIFGGTGMNILNPALTARAFMFFAFPADISGTDPWIASTASAMLFDGGATKVVDGFTGATALLHAAGTTKVAAGGMDALMANAGFSVKDLFIGLVPGSIGETSALACLIGAAILIITGVGSWQIMLGVTAGALGMSGILYASAGPDSAPIMQLNPLYHLTMGGFMFGMVYMATDPVSAAATNTGKYIYGALIGVLCILIRLFNPAYPEGMMLSIIFMNIFAPLIDHFVVQKNISRRLKRATAG